jgi:hypothetical protein
MLVSHFNVVRPVRKTLQCCIRTTRFECSSETKFNAVLLGLYICSRIIGYGHFVYKIAIFASSAATANAECRVSGQLHAGAGIRGLWFNE